MGAAIGRFDADGHGCALCGWVAVAGAMYSVGKEAEGLSEVTGRENEPRFKRIFKNTTTIS